MAGADIFVAAGAGIPDPGAGAVEGTPVEEGAGIMVMAAEEEEEGGIMLGIEVDMGGEGDREGGEGGILIRGCQCLRNLL